MSDDDTRRAEAFALYNSFIARGWGDGDKAAFASRAEAAIEAAGVFNETWENRNQNDRQADEMAEACIAWEDLQRDHDALRAELDAAKTKIRFQEIDLNCARKERDTGYSMAEAAKKRIAELEAYKARVEALPVGRYLRCDVWPGDVARNGRFIPAEGE